MDKPNIFPDRVDYELSNDHGLDRGQKYNRAVFNVWIMMTKAKMYGLSLLTSIGYDSLIMTNR